MTSSAGSEAKNRTSSWLSERQVRSVEALKRTADRIVQRERERSRRLVCAECGDASDTFTDGWRALLTAEEDGSESVAVFCPKCAEEFGQP
jgi:RNase P subunit RPR2